MSKSHYYLLGLLSICIVFWGIGIIVYAEECPKVDIGECKIIDYGEYSISDCVSNIVSCTCDYAQDPSCLIECAHACTLALEQTGIPCPPGFCDSQCPPEVVGWWCPEPVCTSGCDCGCEPEPPPEPKECTYIVCVNNHNVTRTGRVPCPPDDPCEPTPNSCSVTATSTPNPIPTGQNQTTISATSLNHTSLSKCTVSGYSLPHTFTQTESSKTYTVTCTGDTGYDDCSDDITVTKGATTCSVSLSASPNPVQVNQNTTLTATVSNCALPIKQYTWHLEDPTKSNASIYTNSGNQNCATLCSSYSKPCVSIGTDSEATNGYYFKFDINRLRCQVQGSGTCNTNPTWSTAMCNYFTRCRCGSSGYQTTTSINTLTYSWSQIGTYKAYVTIIDNNNQTAQSNDVYITVSDVVTRYSCDSNSGCKEVGASAGKFATKTQCESNCKHYCVNATTCSSTYVDFSLDENKDKQICTSNGDCGGPPPLGCTVTISANPTTLVFGKSLTLTWEPTNCNSCIATTYLKDSSGELTNFNENDWYNNPLTLQTTPSSPLNTSHDTIVIPDQKGTFVYEITCDGESATTGATTDTEDTDDVRVIQLPWWREIIPNLGGFLRGLWK